MKQDSLSDIGSYTISALAWTSSGFSLALLYTGKSLPITMIGTLSGAVLGIEFMRKTTDRGD